MSIVSRSVRGSVERMEVYKVQPVEGIKLDANESPYGMPEDVKQALASWLLEEENLREYPDTDCLQLRARISSYYGLAPENVLPAVGSDQLIDLLGKTFLEEGDRILVPDPSFSMYAISAAVNHGKAVPFPLTADYEYDPGVILQKAAEVSPKIVYLCSPNNPTGGVIEEDDLRYLLENLSCVVVLDEAYGEFSGETHASWVKEFPNLAVLKTFSKAYGLAGLRVGYMLASEELTEALNKVRAPYHLNTFSQKAAVLLLGHPAIAAQVNEIAAERERLYAALAPYNGKKGFRVYPSRANYLYITTGGQEGGLPFETLSGAMKKAGVSLRIWPGGALRATVGTHEQNDVWLAVLTQLLEEE